MQAPRQTGKTSYLLALMEYLNQTGEYHCLYINVEAAQAERENIATAMQIIFIQLAEHGQMFLQDPFLANHRQEILHKAPHDTLDMALSRGCQATDKPIVLLIDEIDTLIGDTLISVELKVLYKSLETTLAEGLPQTWEYMDKCGTTDGHLIIFDRRKGRPWAEKIFRREETYQGQSITVWGM